MHLFLLAFVVTGLWELQLFVHNATDAHGATWIYGFPEYPTAFRL